MISLPRRIDREGPIQRAIIQYLRASLPGCVVASVPNSTDVRGRSAAIAIAKQKRDGLLPGFPDVWCGWRGQALLIEVKAKGGRTSPAQDDVHARLRANGFDVIVAYGIDDVTPAVAVMKAKDPAGAGP